MAGNYGQIKGITVEISGTTTKLNDALKETNRAAKTTQQELNQINKQLKYDPTNVTLIAQKHEILGKRVEEVKGRLNTLKQAQDQFDQELMKTDEGAAQYRALQREIIKTEGNLKYLQEQYNQTDATTVKLQQVSGRIGEIGDKATEAGKKLSTHVTAPIVAVGAASLKSFQEVDSGLDIVESKTGASGKALESMQGIAKNLATELPTDFETAGSAVGEVNTRFGVTGDKLEDLSKKFIQFADLNDTDVSSSVDQVSSVLNSFGQSSSEAGDVLDALNSTGQATGISMDTLANDLSSNAAQFKEMGLTAQQAAGFMGMVEMSGLDTSTAMAGLKKAMKNAADDGQTLDQAMKGFSDTMKSNKSDTEKLQAAYGLFGSKAGAAIYNAAKSGKLNLQDLTGTLGNFSGSVDKTFKSTLDPIDQFQMSLNSLKLVGADIGNSLATVLQPALQRLSARLKELSSAYSKLPPGMQQTIIRVALVAAAIGPLVVVIGSVCSGIKRIIDLGILLRSLNLGTRITSGIGVIKGGLSGLYALIMAHPVIAITVAIVAALVMLYTRCEWFRNGVNNILHTLYSVTTSIGSMIVSFIRGVIVFILSIPGTVNGVVVSIIGIAYNLFWGVVGSVQSLESRCINLLASLLGYAVSWAGGLLSRSQGWAGHLVGSIFSTLSSGLGSVSSSMYRWGADMIDGLVRGLLSGVHRISSAAGKVARAIWSKLHFSRPEEGVLRDYETWMPDMIHGLAQSMQNALPELDAAAGQLGSHIQLGVVAPSTNGKSIPTYQVGDIKITINTQPGQNAKDIAKEVQKMIVHDIQRNR